MPTKFINQVIDKFYSNILHKQKLFAQQLLNKTQQFSSSNGDSHVSYLGQSYTLQVTPANIIICLSLMIFAC